MALAGIDQSSILLAPAQDQRQHPQPVTPKQADARGNRKHGAVVLDFLHPRAVQSYF